MTKKPWLAIGAATIAAVCLVGSMFSHRWLVPDYGDDDGFSPRSFQMCVYRDSAVIGCQVGANSDVVQAIDTSAGTGSPPSSPLFVPSGTLAFFAAFLAFAGLITTALLAAMGRRNQLPVSPTTIATLAIIVGAVGAALFLASRPGMSPAVGGPFHASYAGLVFGLGSIVGLVAVRRLARVIRFVAEPAVQRPRDPSKPKRRRGKR